MKVDLKIIQKVSRGHGSFAVWRDANIDDISVISEEVGNLHGRVIFVGFNASSDILPFQNFHKTHVGGRDKWLAESIGSNLLLRGAYMTDFFKGDYSVRQAGVNVDSESEQKNLQILRDEISCFVSDNPILVAFGIKTFDLLKKLGFSPKYLPHYARRGITKKEFIKLVNEIV